MTYAGCSRSLGHILTLNISKTIKDIKTRLTYSESLQSQVLHGMFKDVQCEHRWSHGTHQADSPIHAKRVPALRCRWLQRLPLFGPSVQKIIGITKNLMNLALKWYQFHLTTIHSSADMRT